MSIYYSFLITIFGVVLVLMLTDPNIGYWIDLQAQNAIIQLKRRYYIITLGVVVKFQTWRLKREIEKIRREYNLPEDNNG